MWGIIIPEGCRGAGRSFGNLQAAGCCLPCHAVSFAECSKDLLDPESGTVWERRSKRLPSKLLRRSQEEESSCTFRVLPDRFLSPAQCWKCPNNFVTVSLIKADFIHDCNGGHPASRSTPMDTIMQLLYLVSSMPTPSFVFPLARYSRFTILPKIHICSLHSDTC